MTLTSDRPVDRLARLFDGYELVGIEQVRGGNMQGIHRADARFRGFLACVAENRLQIVKESRSPKVTLVEAILVLPPVVEGFR